MIDVDTINLIEEIFKIFDWEDSGCLSIERIFFVYLALIEAEGYDGY